MFNEEIYDLSRQVHMLYSTQFERLYVPLQDEKPSLVRRLLAALRRFGSERAPKPISTNSVQRVSTGTIAR
jgi:hypothetical protein